MIIRSRLDLAIDADAALTAAELQQAADQAGWSCPVSNTFRAAGVELQVEVRLASG